MHSMLDPDIGGSMTEAIMRSSERLNCKCCNIGKKQLKAKVNLDGGNIDQTINPRFENMTIILEISKYFGKDINIVITYELFKKINQQLTDVKKDGKKGYDTLEIRRMFIVALQNLKYMGYISPSRLNTFLFKKNYYGKPIAAEKLLSQQEKERLEGLENQENIKALFNAKKADESVPKPIAGVHKRKK
jgi:hypothetical protein